MYKIIVGLWNVDVELYISVTRNTLFLYSGLWIFDFGLWISLTHCINYRWIMDFRYLHFGYLVTQNTILSLDSRL